jgi:hypothetical protein
VPIRISGDFQAKRTCPMHVCVGELKPLRIGIELCRDVMLLDGSVEASASMTCQSAHEKMLPDATEHKIIGRARPVPGSAGVLTLRPGKASQSFSLDKRGHVPHRLGVDKTGDVAFRLLSPAAYGLRLGYYFLRGVIPHILILRVCAFDGWDPRRGHHLLATRAGAICFSHKIEVLWRNPCDVVSEPT